MGSFRCRWVRDRLPLLAGDELGGSERRRVERHLIACPGCREHRDALSRALEVLATASAVSPVGSAAAPSLWPALARQIRESRRPVAAPAFSLPFGLAPSWPSVRFWPALGLSLTLLAAIGTTVGVRQRVSHLRAEIAANERPIWPPLHAARPSVAAGAPAPNLAATSSADSSIADNAPHARLDYDLEHGTPMPPDARDLKPAAY